jgi:hypothetical protein
MTFRVRAAFRPSAEAVEVEDFIFETWRQTIVDGALAKLKAMPGEFWTDQLGAEKAAACFSAGASRAKNDRTRGYHNGNLQVAPRRFC